MAGRHIPVFLVACLCLLAGCSAFGGGLAGEPPGTRVPTSTSTATPTPTDRSTTTVGPGADSTATSTATAEPSPDYPPGLSTDGVADAAALATAHAGTLRTGPYRMFRATIVDGYNSSSAIVAERTTVWDGGSQYQYHRTREGGLVAASVVTDVYADGSTAYRRQSIHRGPRRETTSYGRLTYPDGTPVPPVAVPHGDPPGDERVALLFGRLGDVSTERYENGTVRVRARSLRGDSLTAGGFVLVNVTRFELVATVAPTGVVRSYRLRAAGTADGDRVHADVRFRAGELAAGRVGPPEWYVRARLDESVEFEPTNGTPAVAGGPAPVETGGPESVDTDGPAPTTTNAYAGPAADSTHAARSATSASPTLPGRWYSAGVGWPSPGINRWFSAG